MKRIGAAVSCLLLLAGLAWAEDYKANAYVYTTFVNVTTRLTKTITFPFKSRSVTIINADTDVVGVKFNGSGSATLMDVAGACILRGSSDIVLDNFGIDSITFIGYLAEASPLTVIVTY